MADNSMASHLNSSSSVSGMDPGTVTTNCDVRVNKSKASCCVPMCNKTGYLMEDGGAVTFHSIPVTDQTRLKSWLVKIRRDPGDMFGMTKYTKICSRHFRKGTDKNGDFLVTAKGRRFLKQSAVPSIFPWGHGKPPRREILRNVATIQKTPDQPMDLDQETSFSKDSKDIEIENLQHELEQLRKELNVQKDAAELFQRERDYLKQLLNKEKRKNQTFSFEQIKHNDKLVCFYTGFPSALEFKECLRVLDPGMNGENIKYTDSRANSEKRNPGSKPKKLNIEDEYLLVLIRLRLGLFIEDLAYRFSISKSTVSRIWLSWVNYMYLKLGQINIWPSQEQIRNTMPESMKEKYPRLEWIIDAFEMQTQRPSSLVLQSQAYSNYKSRTTLKGLLACTPSGQIGFISQLYTGSISDRELTVRSGFLRMQHNKGAMWLVDKGFQIEDLAQPLGVEVNMPAFVGARSQMSATEVFHTQQVASERIHIERAINKVKNFHIFDSAIPLSMYGSINQVWAICALLTLFQNPIISA